MCESTQQGLDFDSAELVFSDGSGDNPRKILMATAQSLMSGHAGRPDAGALLTQIQLGVVTPEELGVTLRFLEGVAERRLEDGVRD